MSASPPFATRLYWEGAPFGDEATAIRETIDRLKATDLQALIVRRVRRWHLAREDDPQARAALQRGKVATILESLRRQDGERFTLPDRLQWAIDDRHVPPGVPHPRIGTTTLAMLLRCGPSGW